MNAVYIFLVLVLVMVVFGVLAVTKNNASGNAAANDLPSGNDQLKIFQGKITNDKLPVGRLEGISYTDNGCYGVGGGGLVECNTDIETSQGSINFIYRHNMATQPCLSMYGKEKVIVDILDAEGNAKVTRTIDVSGKKMH